MQPDLKRASSGRGSKLTTLFVVHRHALVRAALCNLVAGSDGLAVAGDCGSVDSAARMIPTVLPDVILVDARELHDGTDTNIIALHRAAPRACLLALVENAADLQGAARMLAGAIDASCDGERLREVVATRLGLEFEPCVVKPSTHAAWDSVTLSRRETHVAVRIAAGLTSKQIAADIGVSLRTVHTYRESLARKLGASSAAVITRFVIERRIAE